MEICCPQCEYNDDGLVSRRCDKCHVANMQALKDRLASADKTGGQSSPNESDLQPTMYVQGLYTGRGETAGGGYRVIRKGNSLS